MDSSVWMRRGTKLAASVMMVGMLAACGGAEEEAAEAPVEAAPAAPSLPAATEVQSLQLQTGAAALAGQTVRVNGLKVLSGLGPKGFWVELPNKNPFLVMTADGTPPAANSMVDVVGVVTVMNDSILTDWVTSGGITENQKLEAEFATEFLQAQAMQPAAGAPAADTAAAGH